MLILVLKEIENMYVFFSELNINKPIFGYRNWISTINFLCVVQTGSDILDNRLKRLVSSIGNVIFCG